MRYQPTDRPTDRPTDTAYYRDARTHLKRDEQRWKRTRDCDQKKEKPIKLKRKNDGNSSKTDERPGKEEKGKGLEIKDENINETKI